MKEFVTVMPTIIIFDVDKQVRIHQEATHS